MLAVPVTEVIDQVPPAVASMNAAVVDPAHTAAAPPVIAETVGNALIVRVEVAMFEHEPLVTVYTTFTLPAVSPVTTPPAVMLAVPVPLVIDHVPPAVASVKAGVVDPTHTEVVPPPIADTVGRAFTVREVVAELEQEPLVTVYTTETVPGVRPVTTPPVVMLAVPVPFVIDHVPPEVASVNEAVVVPTQTNVAPPDIADTDGVEFTVRTAALELTELPPPQFVIVQRYW